MIAGNLTSRDLLNISVFDRPWLFDKEILSFFDRFSQISINIPDGYYNSYTKARPQIEMSQNQRFYFPVI